MTSTEGILATSSPRRGRSSVKRKLIEDEDIPSSPAKRTRSRTIDVYREEFSPPEKMAPLSFYGRSTNNYLSPLERVNIAPRVSPAPSTSPVSASPLVGAKKRRSIVKRPQSAKQSSKKKTFFQKERNIVLNGSVEIESPSATQENEESVESTVPPTPEPTSTSKTKKFFRHRSSPGEEAIARGSSVILRKGFKLTYHRSSSAKSSPISPATKTFKGSDLLPSLAKIKMVYGVKKPVVEKENPYSQDMFSETSDNGCVDDIDENMIVSQSQSPRKSTRKSPRKNYSCNSPCSSPLREHNRGVHHKPMSDLSSPDSVKNDSVMLLSELSSMTDSSVQSESPINSINKSTMFSIFNARTSPRKRSVMSSSPSSTAPNSPSMASSLPGSATRSKHVLRSFTDRDGREQMVLDFGQKIRGTIQCSTCGMTYTDGQPADEQTHNKFHQNVVHVLKFSGWKRERICQDNPDGSRIIVVTTEDKFATKKVDAVRQIVDNELGFVVERRKLTSGMKTFLYISEEKQIIACCIAQEIRKGYRVISESPVKGSQSASTKPWCCSTMPEPAKCGISRIWVISSQRGKKIASQLIDCVRNHFMLGYLLKKEQLAFSDPTPDGRAFATTYSGTPAFLVYKLDSRSMQSP